MRYLLKNILSLLAKLAIKKHKIKIDVVFGIYGTELTRELVYSIISTKKSARRMVNNIWWDLSIPLTILGFKDEKRNVFTWGYVILKSILLLIFKKPNHHHLILNINSAESQTLKYWSDFVKPNTLLLLNSGGDNSLFSYLISNTKKNNGVIIYNGSENIKKEIGKYKNVFTFGERKQNRDLEYLQYKDSIKFFYKDTEFNLPIKDLIWKDYSILAGSVSVGLRYNVEAIDIIYGILKCPMEEYMFNKLKKTLLS